MTMLQYANLHFHSTHSDGVYTPKQLVDLAKEEGYRAIALTDHDTVTGCDELARLAAERGMESIFAAEFTTAKERYGWCFHIVGMFFDPTHPQMKEYLRQLSYKETHETQVLFQRGLEAGFLHDITWDEVLAYNEGITWLCNEHVFRAMKAKGLATDLDYPVFFRNVYGNHRGEVPPSYPFREPDELIALIHAAGGIAILAHPHKQLCYLERLRAAGLDGVEVWHHMLTDRERIEVLRFCIEHGLYVSGGTDHDGLMGGQYSRYPDPRVTEFWLEPRTMGTQPLFFEEIKQRRLAPTQEREAILWELEAEVYGKGETV